MEGPDGTEILESSPEGKLQGVLRPELRGGEDELYLCGGEGQPGDVEGSAVPAQEAVPPQVEESWLDTLSVGEVTNLPRLADLR